MSLNKVKFGVLLINIYYNLFLVVFEICVFASTTNLTRILNKVNFISPLCGPFGPECLGGSGEIHSSVPRKAVKGLHLNRPGQRSLGAARSALVSCLAEHTNTGTKRHGQQYHRLTFL